MAALSTRVSSKGQVVIPAAVRDRLHLAAGESLTVEAGPDGERTVILRASDRAHVERLLERGYAWLETAGDERGNLVEAFHALRRDSGKR